MSKLSLNAPLHLLVSTSIGPDELLELTDYLNHLFDTSIQVESVAPGQWFDAVMAAARQHCSWLGFLDRSDLEHPALTKAMHHPSFRDVMQQCALYTHEPFEESLKDAERFGLHTIMNPSRPEFLQVVLCWLAFQQTLPVESVLSTSLSTYTITSTSSMQQAFSAIQKDCEAQGIRDLEGLSTALMEALTNAVYHAPHNANGEELYEKGQPIHALPPQHYVTVKAGMTESGYLVQVHDQCGTLTADNVMYWLNRNLSGQGMFDSHGRGLFLMQQLTDQVIVAIDPGHSSDIFLVKHRDGNSPSNGGSSPLYLFSKSTAQPVSVA